MPTAIAKRPKIELTTRQKTIPKKWARLLGLLPGYDSIATAPEGYWFNTKAAQLAIDFFPECLQHVKGELGGQPFALLPWLQSVTAAIYGWMTPEGLRRYREVLVYVPRKNAKTMWSAGVVVKTLIMDPEPGIEAYSAASDRSQAALTYNYVRGMIEQEESLSTRLKVYTSLKSVEYAAKYGTYLALSSIPKSKHGFNPHLVINDELHAHKSPELVDVLSTGTGARTQPLIIHTTTADWLRESLCNEKYEYGCKVRDRVIDDSSFLPVIYEARPPEDEQDRPLWWTDEAVWWQANPSLGASLSLEYLRRECKRALELPRFRNTFKRLHLNIRTGQDTEWIGLEAWDRCKDETLDADALIGQRCFAGFDLATVHDLTAFVLWFPEESTFLSWFWLPRDTVSKRLDSSGVPYQAWVDMGLITLTPGNVTDYKWVEQDIFRIAETYDLQSIAIDRFNSTGTQTALSEEGLSVIPFGQGTGSMSAPSKEFERMVVGQTLRHDGNAVMRWMVSHVAVDMNPAGDIKPNKDRSAEKIDGVVALIMAIGRALVTPETQGGSVYDERGLLVL